MLNVESPTDGTTPSSNTMLSTEGSSVLLNVESPIDADPSFDMLDTVASTSVPELNGSRSARRDGGNDEDVDDGRNVGGEGNGSSTTSGDDCGVEESVEVSSIPQRAPPLSLYAP